MARAPQAVLLHDGVAGEGPADARDVLIEAQHVARALERLGYGVLIVPVDADLAALQRTLADIAPRIVFNLVESIDGEARLIDGVPRLLEASAIPFTGCGSRAQSLTSNKPAAKRAMHAAGIRVPQSFAAAAARGGPWIVKSVWEHASVGLDDASLVASAARVPGALEERRRQYGGEWFAERFIEGRELNVAMIESDRGPRVLPVAEIRFVGYPRGKPRIVGYAAKWRPESFEYRRTVREFVAGEGELCAHAAHTGRACWELFGLTGYARIDLRVDAHGETWVLEVNANPCLSPDAGFAAALAEAGIGFDTAMQWLVAEAIERASRTPPVAACSDVQHS